MRPIDADDLQKSLNDYVFNDPTCPMHIAATVDQYIDFAPTVGGWMEKNSTYPDESGNCMGVITMYEINKALLLSRILHSGDFTALEKRYLEKLVVADSNVGHWMPEVSAAPRKGWQCSSCLAMTETAHYCYQCYFDYCPKCGTKLRLRMEVNNGNAK